MRIEEMPRFYKKNLVPLYLINGYAQRSRVVNETIIQGLDDNGCMLLNNKSNFVSG